MTVPLPESNATAWHPFKYTEAQLRSYGEACAAAERQRCIEIIETHQVPVGNSRAGEIAAEMTIDALREVRDAIRSDP